jgi:DNA-binding beta-propeller fold protein YncE
MKTNAFNSCFRLLFAVISLVLFPAIAGAEVKASYLYNLSNFTGVIPFTWVRVVQDEARNEVYVCDGNLVYVFNAVGMEIYRFGEDERLGIPLDVTVLESGDLLLLSIFHDGSPSPSLIRCDYRGEFLERRPVSGIPDDFGTFTPTRMVLRGEKLYLADLSQMKAAVADRGGFIRESIDIAEILEMKKKQVQDQLALNGFDADHEGNIYFTLPTLFKAYRLSADRTAESFGRPGGAPGRFGVVAGIAVDRSGAIYVADTLRCVVLAFDRDFNFLYEFGYRTFRPGGLVAPKEVTVSLGRIYVTQQGIRGVTVYRKISN